jgi:hypothetical protein
VGGDADALARTQPAGVTLPPVGAWGSVVQEVGVDVDEHALRLVLLVIGQVGIARLGRAVAQADLILVLFVQGQIGIVGGLLFGDAVFVIDVVEAIDGGFPG